TTLRPPLAWQNSSLLQGDVPDAVSRLKGTMENDLLIMGSGELAQSLMQRNVIDDYVLLIHPLVLGNGRRLFSDGGASLRLQLASSRATDKGVVIATYNPEVTEVTKVTNGRGD